MDEVGDEGNSTSWACDELSRHRWAVHRHKYQQTTNLQITIWFDYKSSHPAEMENLIYSTLGLIHNSSYITTYSHNTFKITRLMLTATAAASVLRHLTM